MAIRPAGRDEAFRPRKDNVPPGVYRSLSRSAPWCATGFLAVVLGCSTDDPIAPFLPSAGRTYGHIAVTFAEGRYVAVGEGSDRDQSGVLLPGTTAINISDDGRTWRDVSPPIAGSLSDVTYGGDRFVAVGTYFPLDTAGNTEQPAPIVVTSPDGEVWTAATGVPPLWWRAVTFGNGRFVATGFNRSTLLDEVAISDDGAVWTVVAVTDIPSTRVGFGNGQFLLWGEANGIGVSLDGESWDVVVIDSVGVVRDIIFADGRFIGMGDYDCCFGEVPGAQRYYNLESSDGRTWNVTTQALRAVRFDHAFGAGRFVAVASAEIVTSTDGLIWSLAHTLDEHVSDVAYGPDGFVAVGHGVHVSRDGLTWESVGMH